MVRKNGGTDHRPIEWYVKTAEPMSYLLNDRHGMQKRQNIFRKKNNYATKYEKLDVYTHSLQNNYTKLEIRKENIYTTSYEILQSQSRSNF